MEMDIRNSFQTITAAKNDAVSPINIKTPLKADGNSFEAELHQKRREADASRNEYYRNKERNADKTDRNFSTDSDKTAKNEGKTRIAEKEREKIKNSVSPEKPENVGEPEKNEASENSAEVSVASQKTEQQNVSQAQPNTHTVEKILSDTQNAKIMEQIAEKLGVAPQEISNVLDKLQIKPEDLLKPENMTKFLMEVTNSAEPTELLMIPDLAKKMKEIGNIINLQIDEAKNTANVYADVSKANEQMNLIKNNLQESVQHADAFAEPENVNEKAQAMQQTATENEKTNHNKEIKPEAKQTQEKTVAEGTGATEISDENTKMQGADKTQSKTAQNNSNSESQTGRNNNGEAQKDSIIKAEINQEKETTPVIIHGKDETIVEVGGKTVSRTAPRADVRSMDVINQVVEKFKIDFKPNSTELNINLRPNDLGNLSIKIVTQNGLVTAEIVAENSKVKELLEENIQTLRDSLKRQGVDVGELSVSVGQQDSDEKMNQFMKQQEKSQIRMKQIIGRINEQESDSLTPVNYAVESEINGNSVDFSA